MTKESSFSSIHDILDALGVPGPVRTETGMTRFVAPQDLLGSAHIIDIRWCDETASGPANPAGIDIIRRFASPENLAEARQSIRDMLSDYEKKMEDNDHAARQAVLHATQHEVWAMHVRPNSSSFALLAGTQTFPDIPAENDESPSLSDAIAFVQKCISDIGGCTENWTHAVKLEEVSHPHLALTPPSKSTIYSLSRSREKQVRGLLAKKTKLRRKI